MNKAKAMRWVKALRSGKYKQTTSELIDNQGNYCCLGVLADITKGIDKSFIATHNLLNKGVYAQCGLLNEYGTPYEGRFIKFSKEKEYSDLAAANDDGVSFKRIATWIEKNYKLL